MKGKAVLFDMDGVLIDSEAVMLRAAMDALREFGIETAPEDFDACLTMAQSMLDARTLCFYAARAIDSLPELIRRALKHYCAYQTQAISLSGGVAGASAMKSSSVRDPGTPGAAPIEMRF